MFRPLLRSLALVLGLATLAGPAKAFDEAQTREIEAIVRDYLVRNPEVLLEALDALETKRAASAEAERRQTIETARSQIQGTPEGTALGNPNGDVTITEFFDYNCGYCKRAASDMAVLLQSDPNLRVVLKEIPVLGPPSEAAARVSLAFREVAPERYGAFHKALLATRGPVDEARAFAVATENGVEAERLRPLLQGAAVQAALSESGSLSMALGINGTPSYVVGDELVAGAVGADVLAEKVANVRACGKATC